MCALIPTRPSAEVSVQVRVRINTYLAVSRGFIKSVGVKFCLHSLVMQLY